MKNDHKKDKKNISQHDDLLDPTHGHESSLGIPYEKLNSNHQKLAKTHKQRGFFKFGKIFLILTSLFVIAGVAFSYRVIFSANEDIVQKENKTPILKQMQYLLGNDDKILQGEKEDRINIVLMGMGGDGHAGGIYLADTIIIASLKPSTNQVAMLSIPRDLVVEINTEETGNLGYRKINNANAFGMQYNYPGGGEALTSGILEELTGLEMHYFVRVDFEGFRKIIDRLGGVTINIDNAFTDKEFPDYNYGYQTIHFDTGEQTLDGEEALQFSRSRKGNNGEGSDFSRSKRQQKILLAVKQKVLSAETLLNPKKISDILGDLGEHVSTNIEIWEMVKFAQLSKKIDSTNLINKVLDDGKNGLLHAERASATNAYILVPNKGLGKYSDIQKLSKNIFETESTTENASGENAVKNTITEENANIEIRNGTKEEGLAGYWSEELNASGFHVVSIGNALTQVGNEKTVIYDFTESNKTDSLKILKEKFNANIAAGIPAYLKENVKNSEQDEKINFIIIIGEDNTKAALKQKEDTSQ